MDGTGGENPVKIRFPNKNLFKCESLSSACPRCPSGQGGHPSLCPPWCPMIPKASSIPTCRFANFHLLPPAPGAAQNLSWNPPGTTSLSMGHSLCSQGFTCLILGLRDAPCQPSSPQPGCSGNTKHSQVSKVFWMLHKGSCLFQPAFCSFTSTHRPESTRGCRGTCLVFNNGISCNK